ncbi:hypothetical protein [Morganella morganii]|uniref:hypothetical protein n=1 Tax=Morganella morganii TaxID=582 RepID=UPI003EC59A33
MITPNGSIIIELTNSGYVNVINKSTGLLAEIPPTGLEQGAGSNAKRMISQKGASDAITNSFGKTFGINQDWSPSSLSFGTTYTNTSDKTMALAATMILSTGNSSASLTVDGKAVSSTAISGGVNFSMRNNLFGVVKPGGKYRIDITGDVTLTSFAGFL